MTSLPRPCHRPHREWRRRKKMTLRHCLQRFSRRSGSTASLGCSRPRASFSASPFSSATSFRAATSSAAVVGAEVGLSGDPVDLAVSPVPITIVAPSMRTMGSSVSTGSIARYEISGASGRSNPHLRQNSRKGGSLRSRTTISPYLAEPRAPFPGDRRSLC